MVSKLMLVIATRTETNDKLTMSLEVTLLFSNQYYRKLKRTLMLPYVRYQKVKIIVVVTRQLGMLSVIYPR